MTWFFIALLNPILHAASNHLDKYLISKYLKSVQIGSLVIFSGLFSIFALPVVLFFSDGILHISVWGGFILTANGALAVLALMFYLYAIAKDEVSFVIPLFQFVPILGLVLSFFFLGEIIQAPKIIGSLIIIAGSAILSFDIRSDKIKFKKKTVLFMFLSSLSIALNVIIFKSFALTNGFWQSLIWDLVGKITFALILFACIGSFRRSFISVLKAHGFRFVLLTGLTEIFTIGGEWALAFASLFAPIFFVQTISTSQPIFVFIFGILITLFFPKASKEALEPRILLQKSVGIAIVIGGSLLFL